MRSGSELSVRGPAVSGDETVPAPPARPGLRAWLGLAVLTLPVAVFGIDMAVLHLAAPHLSADLAPSASQLLWIVDVYGFVIVGFLITMGALGDRVGRRQLLMIGAAAFAVASVLAALSPSAELLIVARALLSAAGAALLLVALPAVVYGVKEIAAHSGYGPGPVPLLAVAGGIAIGASFLRRQRRLAHPLLDLSLFAHRTFTASLGIVLLGALTFAGTQFLVVQHLQTVLGLSPLRAGLWILPATLANVVTVLVAPLLARRIPLPALMASCLAVMAAGLGLLTRAGPDGDLAAAVTAFAVLSAGLRPVMALSTHLATSAAPPERTGTAACVTETTSELGIALGIATMGSLGGAVYRREIDGEIPGSVPPRAAEAAQETAGAAVTPPPGCRRGRATPCWTPPPRRSPGDCRSARPRARSCSW